jgi:hypothetical protein
MDEEETTWAARACHCGEPLTWKTLHEGPNERWLGMCQACGWDDGLPPRAAELRAPRSVSDVSRWAREVAPPLVSTLDSPI